MEENELINLFRKDLINLNNKATSQEEFFDSAYSELYKKEYVKDNFKESIIQREKKYPTGLLLEDVSIAIPHTDSEHIKEAFVYINKLEHEISFYQMGNEEEIVAVKDVWMLGIKNPGKQVNLLAFIMELFNNPEFVQKYKEVSESEDLLTLIKENIK